MKQQKKLTLVTLQPQRALLVWSTTRAGLPVSPRAVTTSPLKLVLFLVLRAASVLTTRLELQLFFVCFTPEIVFFTVLWADLRQSLTWNFVFSCCCCCCCRFLSPFICLGSGVVLSIIIEVL